MANISIGCYDRHIQGFCHQRYFCFNFTCLSPQVHSITEVAQSSFSYRKIFHDSYSFMENIFMGNLPNVCLIDVLNSYFSLSSFSMFVLFCFHICVWVTLSPWSFQPSSESLLNWIELFPFTHNGCMWVHVSVLTCSSNLLQRCYPSQASGYTLFLVEVTDAYFFHLRFELTLRVWVILSKTGRLTGTPWWPGSKPMKNIYLFPMCLEIKHPSVLLFHCFPSCVDL